LAVLFAWLCAVPAMPTANSSEGKIAQIRDKPILFSF
jgi:hypothetical protein